jgi:hypothetical protein
VQCLLDHGAAINVRTHSDGRTPLTGRQSWRRCTSTPPAG